MTRSIHLLIVDPQNDFCDLPDSYRPTDPLTGSAVEPALPIAGAHADMQRLARFIDATAHALSSITVTLDSHHRLDIAHPTFWRAGNGDPVPPFTPITAAQLRAGEFVPRHDDDVPRTLNYLDELEARGRYTLMAWPVHCEIGTWGHNVHADVRAAYGRWEEDRQFIVRKVPKGANPWTEHYSALMAEVPDADDPRSQLNRGLLDSLDRADLILVAGEAGSHCVKATVEHLAEHLPGGNLSRIVLLTDCMSPVAGFANAQAGFLHRMRDLGVQQRTSTDMARALA
ncbi:cysteine hydrolase [Achromobacter sp. 77]|uniref:cysteine hydrolase n=1 Tax=Achromobacter TaxID=222 RepID=UPI001D017B39|nr:MULTISPECIES: cysteine hydrolase [Achromobacter]MCU6617649.1 cysteine hydrolase [Achromobacter mucicolens]UDG75654.1 cysteine hydrolase [Achromobacter sp. 77]